jgi:hypothetical protein
MAQSPNVGLVFVKAAGAARPARLTRHSLQVDARETDERPGDRPPNHPDLLGSVGSYLGPDEALIALADYLIQDRPVVGEGSAAGVVDADRGGVLQPDSALGQIVSSGPVSGVVHTGDASVSVARTPALIQSFQSSSVDCPDAVSRRCWN